MKKGVPFLAKPNYRNFRQELRPCYMPIYHRPQLPTESELGQAITNGWPCEGYWWHNQTAGPNCLARKGVEKGGDWITVIRQVWGQQIRDEHFRRSKVWDAVLVPVEHASDWAQRHHCRLKELNGAYYYVGFTPDIWLGNTGWRDIPYDPADEL